MRCHVGFDLPDLREARARNDVLVVVDVLSFSTAVATGVSRGVEFLPAGSRRRVEALCVDQGAVPSVSRMEGREDGRYSLSPLSYTEAPRGLRVALRSPNGARLTVASQGAPAVIVGSIVNATAAGQAAAAAAHAAESGVTVIACGERVKGVRRRRRFAAEDLLGAGAVAEATGLPLSGDAVVAVRAFRSCRDDLERVLLATDSGRELETAGFGEDVRHAASLDLISDVPVLIDGKIRAG